MSEQPQTRCQTRAPCVPTCVGLKPLTPCGVAHRITDRALTAQVPYCSGMMHTCLESEQGSRMCCRGPVAQWIRRWSSEPKIAGSSPARVTSHAARMFQIHNSAEQNLSLFSTASAHTQCTHECCWHQLPSHARKLRRHHKRAWAHVPPMLRKRALTSMVPRAGSHACLAQR